MILTVKECQAEIPKKGLPLNLSNAASLAVWMIVERDYSLRQAIRTSAKKFAVTQVSTEAVIRDVIPFEFFEERSQGYVSRKVKIPTQANNAYRNTMITRHKDKQHMRAIAQGG